MPHAKFADRAAGLRASSRRRRLLVCLCLVLVAALAWLVWFSSLLSVRTIRVEGSQGALTQQVRQEARSTLGEPLARVDVAKVRRAVAGLGPVAGVEVERGFPSTLVVRVVPRTPVLVITGQDGSRRLVDRDGRAYAPAGSVGGLPVVPVGTGATSPAQLRSLAAVLGALDGGQRAQVTALQADRGGWVTFRMGALQVLWGDGSASAAKARTLRAMQPVAAGQKATRLDISTPGRPVLS
ncbi:cell division protein FtsQ/DivIB [Luteipulveratus halotolerans]|uniref:cell division protein FtsQ/DivIB n=1 Tax=Luteipulveratus halotolerans TaxID=1631356 RepID=UPI000683021C|nr:FtsQ-type POTRA domain-containing protein [Luteipulveratus halotolerans]